MNWIKKSEMPLITALLFLLAAMMALFAPTAARAQSNVTAIDETDTQYLGVPNDVKNAYLYHAQIAAASATSASLAFTVDVSNFKSVVMQVLGNKTGSYQTDADQITISSATGGKLISRGYAGGSHFFVSGTPFYATNTVAPVGVKYATSGLYVTGATETILYNYGIYDIDVGALNILQISCYNPAAVTQEILIRTVP